MDFETDLTITTVEELRQALKHSTPKLVSYLSENAEVPSKLWPALLLWLLRLEHDVFTEMESERGSTLWIRSKACGYKSFTAFHNTFRHIMIFLKSDVPFDTSSLQPWQPVPRCKRLRRVDVGYNVLYNVLRRCILDKSVKKSVTEGMSPARASLWSSSLNEIYRLGHYF